MEIENTEALKIWLANSLSQITNADPSALAKYIVALLRKKNMQQDLLKKLCLDQLEIFLSTETKSFVDLLFDALKSKCYLETPSKPASPKSDKNLTSSITKTSQSPAVPEKTQERENGRGKNISSDSSKSSSSTNIKRNVKSPQRETYIPSAARDRSVPAARKRSTSSNRDSRPPSRKKSRTSDPKQRSRSNSGSSTASSRTSSREREPAMVQRPEVIYGDTDYRQKKENAVISSSVKAVMPRAPMRRCKDYDEKGYCMKGDLCKFVHGTDAILVEDVSVLNFVASNERDRSSVPHPNPPVKSAFLPSSKVVLPPLPETPPPIQPPPPAMPPPPVMSIPPPGFMEPYNPEAPAMNFVSPPYTINLSVPPPPTFPVKPPMPGMVFNMAPLYKPERTRELVGIKTVENIPSDNFMSDMMEKDRIKNLLPSSSSKSNCLKSIPCNEFPEKNKFKGEVERRGNFNYNRLGPNRKTLELRKVPKNLNTIEMLNKHFSRFGRIVNLTVGIENDPESALVEFEDNSQAAAAYRCSEAVFNNRFIKVFYYNKDRTNTRDSMASSQEKNKERSIPELDSTTETPSSTSEKKYVSSSINRIVQNDKTAVYTAKPTPPRTVFIPSAPLKKSNFINSSSFSSARESHRRMKEEIGRKKDALTIQKRLELFKTKQSLLKLQIQNQKLMLDKCNKLKSGPEKDFLKETVKEMTTKISSLQNDVKTESEILKSLLNAASATQSSLLTKTEAERQLLDAEMDLYRVESTGESTRELLSKVNELKEKARTLGLIESYPVSSTRKGPKYSKQSLVNSSSLSVDHRPKKIFVYKKTELTKEDITRHFLQFGNIGSFQEVPTGYIIAFPTRLEAECAFNRGSKVGDSVLSVSWFNDPKLNFIQNNDSSVTMGTTDVAMEEAENVVVDEEEEEEEEEEPDRSWRR